MTRITFKKRKNARYDYDIYIDNKLEGELTSDGGRIWRYICDRVFLDDTIYGEDLETAKKIVKWKILWELTIEDGKELFGDDFLEG